MSAVATADHAATPSLLPPSDGSRPPSYTKLPCKHERAQGDPRRSEVGTGGTARTFSSARAGGAGGACAWRMACACLAGDSPASCASVGSPCMSHASCASVGSPCMTHTAAVSAPCRAKHAQARVHVRVCCPNCQSGAECPPHTEATKPSRSAPFTHLAHRRVAEQPRWPRTAWCQLSP